MTTIEFMGRLEGIDETIYNFLMYQCEYRSPFSAGKNEVSPFQLTEILGRWMPHVGEKDDLVLDRLKYLVDYYIYIKNHVEEIHIMMDLDEL